MPYPQVSQELESGTTLNARARKKGKSNETSQKKREMMNGHIGHFSELALARLNRRPWEPSNKRGKSAFAMQKEICATYNNLPSTDFGRLITIAGRKDGPIDVRMFLSKRLDNPGYTLQEYIDSTPSLRGH
ncbi:MAG TPA: hypothetical protein PLD99_02295 [Parcubacteria group bacterium]|nr:hypothetical protein [Parcubacteria group bacterium]